MEERLSYQKLLFKKAFEIEKIIEGIFYCAKQRRKKPFLPTGLPGADILLVKLKPSLDESCFLWEGKEGEAMVKAFERLGIPLYKVFGTAAWKCQNCWADCPYLFQELLIVEPEKVLTFGKKTAEKLSQDLHLEIKWGKGRIFHFSFTSLLCLPDLKNVLTEEKEKLYLWQQLKNFFKS